MRETGVRGESGIRQSRQSLLHNLNRAIGFSQM